MNKSKNKPEKETTILFKPRREKDNYKLRLIKELGKKHKIPRLYFCDCCKTVAHFYLEELAYSTRKHNGFWGDWHEKYYCKEFCKLGGDLVRFTLCAGIGEMRHATHVDNWENIPIKQKKEIINILKNIFGGLGWKSLPIERNHVYKNYIPERLFWKLLKLTHDGFAIQELWGTTYGGEKWRNGIAYAMKLYKYICLGDIGGACIWFDTLINHCHNGGIMLNKFNCNYLGQAYRIKELLKEKKDGNVEYLNNMIDRISNCSLCTTYILLAPSG